MSLVDATARHLRLLTETIAAVNSSLDLQEVLELVASKVADALGTDACFVYLYDERADELVLRATHGTRVEELTRTPRMRPGEGITGVAAAERAPVMIAAQAHLDPRFKQFPNLPEDEYESILAVPILARDTLEGALNVRTREPRTFTDAEIELLVAIAVAGGADDRAREAVRARAAARRGARGARAHLGGRLGVALPRGVARGDREDDDGVAARDGRRARARGREDRVARGPRRRLRRAPAAALEAPADRRARLRSGHAVLARRRGAARGDRAPRRGRARARASGHARRARSGDPPPREEQPAVRRLAPPAAGASGERRRAEVAATTPSTGSSRSPPCTRCSPSIARTTSISASSSIGLRAMLVQGLVAGKDVSAAARAGLARGSAGDGARARLHRALPERARARRRARLDRARAAQRRGRADDRRRRRRDSDGEATGTGLSIVRALVRDELRGELSLENVAGLRAEVVFPA